MEKRYLLWLAMSFILLFATAILPTFSVASKAGQGNIEARATHILVGKVKSVESSWNEEKTFIYSQVTVTVEKVLKGTVKGNEVVVRHLGGEVGTIGQWTEHEPSFKRGERVKLYLKQEQNGVYTVVGGEEGKKSLDAKEVTSPGYNWPGRKWPVASLPVPYWLNYAGAPAGTVEATQLSFQTWEEDPGSYMDYTMAGTTSKTGRAYDGTNLVFWGYYDGPGNVLAVCTYWYSGTTILEFDIWMDSGDNWQIWEATASPTAFDVRNVLTHEAGHSLGLGDLYGSADSSETMYGYSSAGQTTKRTLYTGDVQGLNVIYPVTYNLGTTVRMDKTGLKPNWPAQVSLRVTAKWIDGKTIGFLWALYVGGQFFPILYVPTVTLPEMCDMVLDADLTTPNLGGTSFPAAWVVAILDPATGNILALDYSLWTYVPGAPSTAPVMTPADFAAQIANSTRLPP